MLSSPQHTKGVHMDTVVIKVWGPGYDYTEIGGEVILGEWRTVGEYCGPAIEQVTTALRAIGRNVRVYTLKGCRVRI
jgi:hypothetical protein